MRARRSRAGACAMLFLALGCGGSGIPAIDAQFEMPPPTARSPEPPQLPERPTVLAVFPFDYAGVPREEGLWDGDVDPIGLEIGPGDSGGFEMHVSDDLLADLLLGGRRIPIDGRDAQVIAWESSVPCAARRGSSKRPVALEGVRVATWSAAHLEYVAYAGVLDRQACRGTALPRRRIRAGALIPGLLYAFRRSELAVVPGPRRTGAPPKADVEETLVLIGPRSGWLATSGARPATYDQGLAGFTRAELPLRRGSSASLLFHVPRSDLAAFAHRGPGLSADIAAMLEDEPMVAISVEILWPGDAETAEAVAMALRVDG